ncbi:MAG: MBL fold metallo-hydrolase [Deltaproteobacteria bacterium]|nr:MBL fold metallo-hydrolase [Deltaproteobacteria bacterium]
MRLRFLGHAAFDLELGGVRLCLDPHKPGALGGRFRLPAIAGPFDALVHTHSHEDHCAWAPAFGTTTVLDRPQVFRGLAVDTRAAFHDAEGGARMGLVRMVSLVGEGLRVVHCGDLGAWDEDDVAWLRGTDVFLVPAGGTYTLDGAQAAQLAEVVGARLTVPMHCADARVDLRLDALDGFTRAWRGALWSGDICRGEDLATISGPTAWIPPPP